MKRLEIVKMHSGGRNMDTMKITGFGGGELSELKSMEHGEAKEALIAMLNRRNDGLGTQWCQDNGVYGLWFDNEAAYLNVGNGVE